MAVLADLKDLVEGLPTTIVPNVTTGHTGHSEDYAAIFALIMPLPLGSDEAENSTLLQSALEGDYQYQLPNGVFDYDTTLEYGNGSTLLGGDSTTLNYTGAGKGLTSSTPGTVTNRLTLERIRIATETGTVGLEIIAHKSGRFRDLEVSGWSTADYRLRCTTAGETVYNVFENCYAGPTAGGIGAAGIGWDIGTFGANTNQFFGCRANVCAVGVSIYDSNANYWDGGAIEGCTVGWQVDASVISRSDYNINANCRFESNTTDYTFGALTNYCRIDNPLIFGTFNGTNLGIGNIIPPVGMLTPRSVDPALLTGVASMGAGNRAWLYRVDQAGTGSNIAVWVGTKSGNIEVGVFAGNGLNGGAAAPLNLGQLATSGSVAMSGLAAGRVLIPLGNRVTVKPGDWLYVIIDNNTATLGAATTSFVENVARGRAGLKDTAIPFPSNPSISSNNWFSGKVFYLALTDT